MLMERLLIANRGEIAARIARTASAMDIETVGVYSEPDRTALHLDAVDLAVALGGATPAESYLRMDAVIDAARSTRADAIHPGYGFLAENAAFAQAVIDAGLIWVGPTPDQIRLLGDKVAAKRAAVDAGVPTTPIIEATPDDVPTDVPMPALVKAAAGGGGRGMRVVRSPGELAEAVAAASREAASAFGDGTVFIEPYIERGRHIEVQIIGDAHGNVVHLHERDCSIQRRNQKIIEEAPAPNLAPAVRQRLLDGAVALARHVGYQNAGTVEFLVGDTDAAGGDDVTVTFLEVNTRLQVEHPVTEAITGLDLVELQLRVATGELLPVDQDAVGEPDGHAIEVRLVAEDPAHDWQPSTGLVSKCGVPDAPDLVRLDSGICSGSEVTPHYDSMVGKLIAHRQSRVAAARTLARVLARTRLDGVASNRAALAAILTESDFLAGAATTAYLAEHPDVVTAPAVDDATRLVLATGAALALESVRHPAGPTSFAPSGWRNLRTQGQRRRLEADGRIDHIEYVRHRNRTEVLLGPWPEPTDDGSLSPDDRRRVAVRHASTGIDPGIDPRSGAGVLAIEIEGRRHRLEVVVDVDPDDSPVAPASVHVRSHAAALTFTEVPVFADHADDAIGAGPVAPLPGTVIAINVADGAAVGEGDLLLVVEAMKMEHRIAASAAATIEAVHVAVGDRVDAGDLLVSYVDDE